MTPEEAKLLISMCINSTLYAKGIAEKPDRISDVTLDELIEANRIVHAWNESDEAKTETGRTVYMTLADRAITAIHTAMSYEGGSPDEPNIVAYANGNYVLVIAERHLRGKK